MRTRPGLIVAALLVAACTDAADPWPERGGPGAPMFSFSANGTQVDTVNGAPIVNGSLGESGHQLAKGFDHGNPSFGDAIIATFYWVGSTYIVDSVVDFVADVNNTRAGNPFHLVEYVSAANRSMATFVATNVRNFPERSSTSGQIYAVRAYLRDSVPDGGIKISAWVGVDDNFATALGAHRSASGSDTTISVAHAGSITLGSGAVAYTVTMSGLWGLDGPQADGYTPFDPGSDGFGLKENAAYRVFPSGGTTDPRWTWFFDQRGGTWLVTTLALNPGTSSTNQPPTAAFTSSCSSLTCSFTSTSSDPDGSISAYSWTFGDGGTSTVQNPSHSYTAGGTYTVTLTVTDNQGATNAVSHSVTVAAANQSPTAAFTSSCTNLTCNFTNQSSDPDGSIAGNSWNFGDGTTSTVASPSHSYTAAGTYTVTLTVTDNQGATNSVQHPVTVSQANQSPTAAFSSSCSVLTCNFTNSSSDPDGSIASNSWNFGDGQTSTTASPSHSYSAAGTYTVTLMVTDNQGATNSVQHPVTVSPANQSPTAAFSSSCSGDACNFTNTSSDPDGSIASNSWNFGDGQTSTAASPSHTYSASGTYTVQLTVIDNQGATNSVSHTVTVNRPPVAAFTSSCNGLACSFTNSSSDPDGSIASNSWNFGDGQTSTTASPSHTYGATGTYTVTLTVTDNRGATNSVQHSVTVTAPNQPPVAAFTPSCSNLSCTFTSSSSDPDGSIASNSWNFGDGQTSTTASPSHTYGAAGTYTVTLTVTDNQGATNSVQHSVTVTAPNQPPVAAFSSSCSALTCNLTSTSSDPDGSISAYSWTFGDGATSAAQNPSHTYGAGGTYTVTLKVTDNRGATNTVSHSVTVTAPNTAPVVNAGPDQTVILGLLYTLNVSFSDPDNGPWTYTIAWGDGSTSSGSRSSAGSFSAGHTYLGLLSQKTIRVTVTDSRGASGSDTKVITLIL